jgi:hypothetical protein
MKHTKLFEGFLAEGGQDCASELCGILMPTVNKITELISHYAVPQDLIKLQTEINKMQKLVSDTIRSSARGAETAELDWDRAPKAPIFVLTLKQRYPQNEERYYNLWYKAAERLPTFSYGGAIAIFKTYCKREELMLEDHEYGFDEEVSEGDYKYITKEKMFGDIKKAIVEIERGSNEAAAKYFGSKTKQEHVKILLGTLNNILDDMTPDEAFGFATEDASDYSDKHNDEFSDDNMKQRQARQQKAQEVINVLKKEFNISIRQK